MILLSSDQSDSREVKSSDEEAEKKDEQEGRPRNKTWISSFPSVDTSIGWDSFGNKERQENEIKE